MLAFERHGAGEPLVLIHGITHRRQIWYPVLDQLAEHREVILVDLPGHGESDPFVTDGLSVPEALRREFRQFLADQQLDRPHVAGNSLGGRVALEAGASGDARSVTTLSPAGFWRSDAEFAYTRRFFMSLVRLNDALGRRGERLAHTKAGRKLMYGTLMAHPRNVPIAHAVGDYHAFNYARPALQELLAAASPFTDPIPSDVPVTIAWAGRDLVLPTRQAKAARQALPQARHVLMRGVGHVPMFDDPELVAGILLRGSESVAAVAPLAPVAPGVKRAGRRVAAATA
jgi:pimeloyl-ACP methyl ester carboxylesterase